MPTRLGRLLIIAFWLATLGWWVSRDLMPRWGATDGPPFAADLADEAVPQSARWDIYHNGQRAGRQTTRIAYRNGDLFEMESTLHDFRLELKALFGLKFEAKVPNWKTIALYSRDGELRSLKSDLRISFVTVNGMTEIEGQMSGDVLDGAFHPTGKITFAGREFKPILQPIPITSRATMNPLQPVARIPGLTPGRSWHVSLVDPLSEIMAAARDQALSQVLPTGVKFKLPGSEPPPSVLAVVRDEPETIMVAGKPVECYVIEYRSDDIQARTFARVSDGKVMRQEAGRGTDAFVLERMD